MRLSFKNLSLISAPYECDLNILDEVVYLKGVRENEKKASPQSLVRGSLTLRVRKQVEINQICVRFSGNHRAKLFIREPDQNTVNPVDKHVNKSLIDDSYKWVFDQDMHVFQPGTYNFPFQFAISPQLPASIEHACGDVRYQVTMNILTKDPTLAKKAVQPITVIRCVSDLIEISCQTVVAMGCWRNLLYYELMISNKTLVIGEDVAIEIKIFPLHEHRYKVHGLKVILEQKIEYSVKGLPCQYRSAFSKCHKIHLKTYDYHGRQGYVQEKISLPIQHDYSRTYPETLDLQIHPCTDNKNDVCNFKISHNLKLGIILEEISERSESPRPSLSHSINSINSIVSETLFPASRSSSRTSETTNQSESDLKAPPFEERTMEWVSRNAKLIREDSRNLDEKVDLSLMTPIYLLDSRSWDGQLPPPSYSALPASRLCEPSSVEKLYHGKCKRLENMPPAYNDVSAF
ncbi:unnamed protein product [Kuraishia capsulata CBS 1993]|uniref:Arrestin C-terminal-like domain-containing protein n=1 Tax=Kuraishia capsulata CBS 1993 TaxID=1382522 RepID=W6MJG5_9ASCO|nr:uncharacterized protein KUCA_T00000543001 [Kuraishia capsulata CBS 1993]CDK24577.1 unnamed protein product [Kuraishia capsulata CBS 1993]